jgi:glycerol-3-phosphate acyltransferase PlsY
MIPALETAPLWLGVTFVAAYLLGSVPFGVVMARVFGLPDPRTIGSGNIGATNMLRTGSKPAAFLTLVLDAGKGGLAVVLARLAFGEDAGHVAGFAAFLGHCYPVFLGFKGGKGVATFFGTILVLAWPVGLAAAATWGVVAGALRYSSLAGMLAAVLAPVWAVVLGRPETVVLLVALAALILLRHAGNIRRLLAGTEPRIGRKA